MHTRDKQAQNIRSARRGAAYLGSRPFISQEETPRCPRRAPLPPHPAQAPGPVRPAGALPAAGAVAPECLRRQRRRPPEVIRIGVAQPATGQPPTFAGSSLSIAHARGWLEEAFKPSGTRVEWYFFKGAGPAVNEALTNRQLDFALQGDLPAIVARAAGLKTRGAGHRRARQHLYRRAARFAAEDRVRPARQARLAVQGHQYASAGAAPAGGQRPHRQGPAPAQSRYRRLHGRADHARHRRRHRRHGTSCACATRARCASSTRARTSRPSIRGRAMCWWPRPSPTSTPRPPGNWSRTPWKPPAGPRTRATAKMCCAPARAGTPYDHWKEDFDGEPLRVRLNPNFDPFPVSRYKDAAEQAYRFRLSRARRRRPVDRHALPEGRAERPRPADLLAGLPAQRQDPEPDAMAAEILSLTAPAALRRRNPQRCRLATMRTPC